MPDKLGFIFGYLGRNEFSIVRNLDNTLVAKYWPISAKVLTLGRFLDVAKLVSFRQKRLYSVPARASQMAVSSAELSSPSTCWPDHPQARPTEMLSTGGSESRR